jgi:hypothetical protein
MVGSGSCERSIRREGCQDGSKPWQRRVLRASCKQTREGVVAHPATYTLGWYPALVSGVPDLGDRTKSVMAAEQLAYFVVELSRTDWL